MSGPRVVLAPDAADFAADAVRRGGGVVVAADEEPDAVFWVTQSRWDEVGGALAASPGATWVQLPSAGVEGVVEAGVVDAERTWTCAKGVYSEPVAEHAMALALAGLRDLPARATARSWGGQGGTSLYDQNVVVLGAGGITGSLLALLAPYRVSTTVLRHDPGKGVPGAGRIVGMDQLDAVLADALVVVLALALTPETENVIGERQLRAMRGDAWLVNVARGRHVDTAALTAALRDGRIGGAALDVTEPEPLPDGHELWTLPNCLVTPHTANPWETARPLLANRLTENVRRFAAGEPLLGLVDVAAGY